MYRLIILRLHFILRFGHHRCHHHRYHSSPPIRSYVETMHKMRNFPLHLHFLPLSIILSTSLACHSPPCRTPVA